MLNLYVVSCAWSFSCHAVHMLSLCDYYDLCDYMPAKGRKGQLTVTLKASTHWPPFTSVVSDGPRIENDSKSRRIQQMSIGLSRFIAVLIIAVLIIAVLIIAVSSYNGHP